MTSRRWLLWATLLVALAHTFAFRHHVTDDAFISFRYLANFLAGDGLFYSSGEPVWGFSNCLWIAMLAPWVALGAEPLTTARMLGVASNLLLVGSVLIGLPNAGERRWNVAGAALLATNGAFLMQGMSGLETSFFSLLLLAALALHTHAGRHGGLALCVDMMGINDRVIAARRDLPPGWRGIEKGDGRYVLSRRPDYIQLGSFLGSSVPLFLSDIELFADEAFHRWYERLEISVDPDTQLVLYRRRPRPGEPLHAAGRARIQRIAARQMKLSAYRY